jgi:hypothetical protein
MRIRIIILAIVAGVASLLIPMAPASAAPAVCAFTGQAGVAPGLYAPGFGPILPQTAAFNFASSGPVGGAAVCSNGVNSVNGSGTLVGWCGLSNAGVLTPPGNGNVAGSPVNITWVSAGTIITIVSTAVPAVAVVNARAAGADPAAGVVPCVTVGAVTFDVVGVAAVLL